VWTVDAFIVGESDPFSLKLALGDSVLLLDVGDRVLLLPVEPAGHGHDNKLPWLENVHPDHSISPNLGAQDLTGQALTVVRSF
jgi:hypothetical protein